MKKILRVNELNQVSRAGPTFLNQRETADQLLSRLLFQSVNRDFKAPDLFVESCGLNLVVSGLLGA